MLLYRYLNTLILSVTTLLLSSSILFAAEVYYLGESSSSQGKTEKNPSYTLQKRLMDLLDFAKYGQYGPDRSGRISGTISEEVNWNDIGGNGNSSFLRKGVYQNTEVNVNAQEKLWSNYVFEGQAFIRRTDDRRIETRKDIRLKQLTTKIYNPSNMLLFGDFYGDFSQFVLGNSLEGLDIKIKPVKWVSMEGIAARSQSPDMNARTYWRNALGGKADIFLFEGSKDFSLFRLGSQVMTSQDDTGTLEFGNIDNPPVDLNSTTGSIDGEINFMKYYTFNFEVARNASIADQSVSGGHDYKGGNAFRMQPGVTVGPVNLKYNYYYCQPDFFTELGSAMADMIQHQFILNWYINKLGVFTFNENYYWDHLGDSARNYRTINDEKYFTLSLRPLEKRPQFSIRPYFNYLDKNSDDPGNSLESTTTTFGLAFNDAIDDQTNYGATYEYRQFLNYFDNSNSDWFHRFGINASREQQLFGRRLYVSAQFNLDTRNTKTQQKMDYQTGFSFSGQYDALDNACFRFGYNLLNADNGQSAGDYFNNRSYLETDLLAERKRNTHFILRGEYNRYIYEVSANSYDESRIICKILTNF